MTSERTVSLKKLIAEKANLILMITLIIGVCLLAYPTASDWWNSFHQTQALAVYVKKVANMEREEFDRMLKEAEEYNK